MNWLKSVYKKKGQLISSQNTDDYQRKLAAESKKWGKHLQVEASGEWYAWLDHPLILKNYQEMGKIENKEWEEWITTYFNGPAKRSFDLGCGAAERSIKIWNKNASLYVEGADISEQRVVEGERKRIEKNISGQFRVADANTLELETNNYDLIFSCHSFHHFLELEYIMQQVSQALTDRGVFILEEYVGPTQFQWTDEQIDLVKSLLALAPPELRMYRFNTLKVWEGRPTIEQVTAESPFESIRSANILPLFKQHFQIIVAKPLGGTIQQLLYNGIIHNFRPEDEQACNYIEAVIDVENALVNAGILPSDFMLLIGKRINI